MEQGQYIKILHENLNQSAEALNIDLNMSFQQDNNLKNTTKSVKIWWFVNNHISILMCQIQSLDLNPIEN